VPSSDKGKGQTRHQAWMSVQYGEGTLSIHCYIHHNLCAATKNTKTNNVGNVGVT